MVVSYYILEIRICPVKQDIGHYLICNRKECYVCSYYIHELIPFLWWKRLGQCSIPLVFFPLLIFSGLDVVAWIFSLLHSQTAWLFNPVAFLVLSFSIAIISTSSISRFFKILWIEVLIVEPYHQEEQGSLKPGRQSPDHICPLRKIIDKGWTLTGICILFFWNWKQPWIQFSKKKSGSSLCNFNISHPLPLCQLELCLSTCYNSFYWLKHKTYSFLSPWYLLLKIFPCFYNLFNFAVNLNSFRSKKFYFYVLTICVSIVSVSNDEVGSIQKAYGYIGPTNCRCSGTKILFIFDSSLYVFLCIYTLYILYTHLYIHTYELFMCTCVYLELILIFFCISLKLATVTLNLVSAHLFWKKREWKGIHPIIYIIWNR